MKNKSCIIIFLATLAFAVFTQSDFSFFLLGFEFLLEIALFVCPRIQSRHIDKVMIPPVPETTVQQEIPLEVQLKNHSCLPVSELQVEVKCRDEWSGKTDRFRGTAMLDGKDETALRFILRARHYGVLSVWAQQVRIMDPLGINYTTSRFPKQLWEVAVLPPLSQIQDPAMGSGTASQTVEWESSLNGRGEDSNAAYELRAYREGEPLRNVHWKISAKTDTLMVKEFEQNKEAMALVYLDLSHGGKACGRKDWDSFLETVAAFAASELHAGNHLEITWLDARLQQCRFPIRREPDLKAALTALLHEKPRSGPAGETAYKEKLSHEAYNATVCISLWGEITRKEAAC